MGTNDELSKSTMSLGDHIEELRWRLIYALAGLGICTVICMIFGTYLVQYLQEPYRAIAPDEPLTALAPADAFIQYMKVSLMAGVIFSSPWIFYHLWQFIAAGLYIKEKRYVYIAVPFCSALFVTGALFFFYVVAPLSLGFFLKFGDLVGIENNWTFQNYISFMTTLMLVFGLAFQTPIAIFILNRIGLVPIASFKNSRKYVFLAMFVIAAVATPPDVISQITLALPLYALFELGILLCYIGSRKKDE